MTQTALLPDRTVIAVEGPDRVAFLQGLVSNDVAAAQPGTAVFAALLTPQGKWLADFFILSDGERLLLDCERAHAAMLVQKLTRFRLRAAVTVTPADLSVYAVWADEPDQGVPAPDPRQAGVSAPDPRLAGAGWRLLGGSAATDATPEAWDAHRLALGLPDGSRDLEADKTVLLEAGFDELHGVSWTKGCYMGQELTARTKYRGLLKRRLTPVAIEGAAPEPGAPILLDGTEVGTMRSSRGRHGIALLRLAAIDAVALHSGSAVLRPRRAPWMGRAVDQLEHAS